MIPIGINVPGSGTTNYLSVPVNAFDAWSTNGATYKIDATTATDGTVVDFPVFVFDQTTEQGIQLMVKNTNNFFKTNDFKARLKIRRETAGDANVRTHWGVLGRFVTTDPDVSAPAVVPAVNVTATTEGAIYDSDWVEVTATGTITENCILVIDVLRIAANELDDLDGLAQVLNVEFEFNQ